VTNASADNNAEAFCASIEQAIAANRPDDISPEVLARVLQSAVRGFAFKTEKAGHYLEPYEKGSVTATETVMAATAIIRAADLNLWDVAMWFNRAGSAPDRDDRGR
jgi:flagellar biosynthesis regulator FlbT